MAAQPGASEVKIFSSVRPLQIQRSFEGATENDIAGQTSAVAAPVSPTPILISSGSQQSGVTIRSSANPVANSTPHQQNFTPAVPGQSAGITIIPTQSSGIVIRSSGTNQPQPIPNQPQPIPNHPQPVPNQPQPGPAPVAIISTKSSSPIQLNAGVPQRPVAVPTATPTIQPHIEYVEEEGPKEFYEEETHSMAEVSIYHPMTPGELVQSLDPYKVFIFAFVVLGVSFLCIMTEDEISLAWILASVSLLSVAAFFKLKL